MQTIENLIQGSPDWHKHRDEHFNASDAPSMKGCSPYKTRDQLLKEYASGISEEVDAGTQMLFNNGHRFEALYRPLAEAIVGQELYPVVGVRGKLSASFDGITMDEDTILEHKTLNDAIRQAKSAVELPLYLRVQMEQQLYISDASKCLFAASKWTGSDELIEEVHHWYFPDLELRKQIIAGWKQFEADLAEYVPFKETLKPAAVATKDLPALSIQVNGSITLISNLDKFGAQLEQFISGIDQTPETDDGFADAESAVKTLKLAEERLQAAESSALAQTTSIDEMRRTVKLYFDTARNTRLALEKMVASRKESIKGEIVATARTTYADHIAKLNERLGKPYMPPIAADFAGAIKGKRTFASLREAVNLEMARVKIESNAVADKINANLKLLRDKAKDHAFLFSDTAQLVLKDAETLTLIIADRIAEHDRAESAKAETLREKIRCEEKAKLEAEEFRKKQDALNAAAKQAQEAAAAIVRYEQARQAQAQVEKRDQDAAVAAAKEKPSAGVPKYQDPVRPTDRQIIDCLCDKFRVHDSKVVEWLCSMDFDEIYKNIKPFAEKFPYRKIS